MEFICIILLIFRIYDAVPKIYYRQLIIYAVIYLPIVSFLTHDIGNPLTIVLTHIFIVASLMYFIRKNFNKKFSVKMFMSILLVHLIVGFFQVLFTFILSLFLSNEVERTFANGTIVLGLTMVSCIYMYIYVKVIDLSNKVKDAKNHLLMYSFISIFIVLLIWFLSNITGSLMSNIQSVSISAFLIVSGTFLTVITCNSAIKYVLEKRARRSAVKKFMEFENLPSSQRIRIDEHDKHLEITLCLALIEDGEKTAKYIKDYWNNFKDSGGEGYAYMGETTKLFNLDNQALAVYLYIKLKKLKSMGLKKVKINVWSYITLTKSKIKPTELIKALDYIIDEIIESTDKDNAALRININIESDGRPSIEVSNRNDRLPAIYAKLVEKIDYSLKVSRDGGLFNLKRIIEDYDCELKVQSDEHFAIKIIL